MGFTWQVRDFDPDKQGDGSTDVQDDENLGFLLGKRIPDTQKPTKRSKKRKADANADAKSERSFDSKKAKRSKDSTAGSEKLEKVIEIVGVDFGTTYTGASYSSNMSSANNAIQNVETDPGGNRHIVKMPSRIAYADENQNWGPAAKTLGNDVIGHWVEPGMNNCCWFKLLLDEQADPSEYDDAHLRSAVGKGTLVLPPGKTVVDVVADFLRLFLRLIMIELRKVRGMEALETTPIHFYVTLPAVWDDRAKIKMENALRKAGFYARPKDKVKFLSEPEAAVITAFKQASERSTCLVKTNLLAVVVDLGGGTVDVEGLKVLSSMPLKLEAIGAGLGGKCGSTTADRCLIAWCIENFGEIFLSIPDFKRGPGSPFMEAFEGAKRRFDGNVKDSFRVSFPALSNQLRSRGETSKFLDQDEGELIIPGAMADFFEKILEDTKRLIRHKAYEIKKTEGLFPQILVLAGGLADSSYIYQQLENFCQNEFDVHIEVVKPANAWGAISYGAVAYGLEHSAVVSRRARRHYMVVQQRAFREGIDPESRAVTVPKLGKRIDGELRMLLHKGELIKTNMKRLNPGAIVIDDLSSEARTGSWKIICSNDDTPPKYADDPGTFQIGELKFDLDPLYNLWANKKSCPRLTTDVSVDPAIADLNITVGGGHAAGTFYLAAHADRKKVGEMVFSC